MSECHPRTACLARARVSSVRADGRAQRAPATSPAQVAGSGTFADVDPRGGDVFADVGGKGQSVRFGVGSRHGGQNGVPSSRAAL